MLDRSNRVEQVRPLCIGEDDSVIRTTFAMGDCGEHEGLRAERGQPLRVTVDVGELRATDVVVVKDRADLSGDQAEAMTLEERLGLVAAVGKKARRSCRDRAFAHRRSFREDPLRDELVSPAGNVADPPAHRRDRQAMGDLGRSHPVSYTHLTLPTIYSA